MNTSKFFFRILSILTLILPCITFQSCKSDEEGLIDKYFDIPQTINVEYGESFDVVSLKVSEDAPVVPASVGNLTYSIDNDNIVRKDYYGSEFNAIGIGSTIIRIYRNDTELIREIPVTVRSPFEFADMPDDSTTIKCGEVFNIFKPNEETKYNISSIYDFTSSNFNVATVGYQGDIRANALGSAIITVKYKMGDRDIVKKITVNVVPTLTLEMVSGETLDLKTKLPEDQIANSFGSYFTSTNTNIAAISGTIIYARKPGSTLLKSGSKGGIIQLTVKEGSLKELFKPLSWLNGSLIYVSTIETGMKNYSCTANEDRTINGRSYRVLEYTPFDKATSITFYCSKNSISPRLEYVIIETGKSSVEVLGWLYSNYSFTTYGSTHPQYFALSYAYSWAFYPENDSWSTLRIKSW